MASTRRLAAHELELGVEEQGTALVRASGDRHSEVPAELPEAPAQVHLHLLGGDVLGQRRPVGVHAPRDEAQGLAIVTRLVAVADVALLLPGAGEVDGALTAEILGVANVRGSMRTAHHQRGREQSASDHAVTHRISSAVGCASESTTMSAPA